jgi:putative tributyrin esterase
MILRGSVFSTVLEMATGLTIVAPNRFKSDDEHPVVYLLHGMSGNSGDWVDYTRLPLYAEAYDAIIVMPEVGRSFYTDMKYGQRFFGYVADELPAIVAQTFNVSSRREDTAVIGASMGGYGALKCALTRPDRYGRCAALSSACLFLKDGLATLRAGSHTEAVREQWGTQLLADFVSIFGEDFAWLPENDLLALAERAGGEAPALYLTCGGEDPFLEDHRRFQAALAERGINRTYEEAPGRHDWRFFDSGLERALAFCLNR